MSIELVPAIVLTLLVLAIVAFLTLHWRLDPRQTSLDSFESLQGRLNEGKPFLVQFHAPL